MGLWLTNLLILLPTLEIQVLFLNLAVPQNFNDLDNKLSNFSDLERLEI